MKTYLLLLWLALTFANFVYEVGKAIFTREGYAPVQVNYTRAARTSFMQGVAVFLTYDMMVTFAG